jgi:hypothetical protein
VPLGGLGRLGRVLRGERRHLACRLRFALGDQRLVIAPRGERLAQGEEVLLAPVAAQRLGDRRLVGLAAVVAQARQHRAVALALADRVEDREPGLAGEVADHVVQMEVHLIERFLHALQMFAARAHEALAVAHEAAHRAHRGRRPKRGVQRAHGVEKLQPLAVLDVGLAAGHVFDVPGVDQAHLQAARLEDLKQRHPVDAGRLHRDGRDLAGDEPVGQRVQVRGEGAERAHRLRVAVRRHGHAMQRGAQIDAGGIGACHGPHAARRLLFLERSRGFGHGRVRATPRRPGG